MKNLVLSILIFVIAAFTLRGGTLVADRAWQILDQVLRARVQQRKHRSLTPAHIEKMAAWKQSGYAPQFLLRLMPLDFSLILSEVH